MRSVVVARHETRSRATSLLDRASSGLWGSQGGLFTHHAKGGHLRTTASATTKARASSRLLSTAAAAATRTLNDDALFAREAHRWDPQVPIERATTPPASWYTSPEVFRREAPLVFHRGWQQVGRTEQVKDAGQYFTGELLGEPYVVVRDQEGQLRAFFNVCRHHASKVATGEGCKSELVCPYHGWTYQLDGRLRVAPRVGGIKEFKPKENGLVPIQVIEWGRWIFINIDSSSDTDLHEELKPLEDVLESTQYHKLEYMCTRNYKVKSNWKVYVDNYLDGGYHVSVLHKTLNAQLDASQYSTQVHGRWSLQSCQGTNNQMEEQLLQERVGKQGAHYAFLYPNFMINRYGNLMDTNRAIPISVDETLVQFDYFMLKDGDTDQENQTKKEMVKALPESLEASIRISDGIQDEDAWVSEMVQQGLNSRAYDVGRYAPQVETAAYAFHQLLASDFRHGLQPSQ